MLMPGGPFRLTILLCAALVVAATSAHAESYFQLRKKVNANTVRIVTGSIEDTAFRIGADMSAVLDDGDDLRILPIMGKGSLQNVTDILYLKGVDVGIIQSDVLAYVRDRKIHKGLDRRLNYITKLYNEEFHLLARKQVGSLEQLAGKRVNIGEPGSGSTVTASIVFQTIGVQIKPTNYDQALALEMLKSGKIDAMVSVAAKPTDLLSTVKAEDGLHLLSIPRSPALLQTYLPGRLKPDDYPKLIAPGSEIETLSVGAVLAVFAWKQDTKRYRNVERFVNALFDNIAEFQKKPRHRKWTEVSLQASVPGWTRFPASEAWLQKRLAVARSGGSGQDDQLQAAFKAFLAKEVPGLADKMNQRQQDELFQRFLIWAKENQ